MIWQILAAYALVRLARELRWLKRWRARRPLVCNVCMAFWSGAAVVGLSLIPVAGWYIVCGVAVSGCCLVALELAEAWKPPPAPPLDLKM